MKLNTLDIIILILLAWFAYKGLKKGFLIEIAQILTIIVGALFYKKVSLYITPWLVKNTSIPEKQISILGVILAFILIATGLYFVARLFTFLLKSLKLNTFNRILGLIFGLLKIILVCGIIYKVIVKIDEKGFLIKSNIVSESIILPFVKDVTDFFVPLLNEFIE